MVKGWHAPPTLVRHRPPGAEPWRERSPIGGPSTERYDHTPAESCAARRLVSPHKKAPSIWAGQNRADESGITVAG
jgi:hypothetical protein